MRRVVFILVLSIFVPFTLAQSYSPEEQKIVDQVLQTWEDRSNGDYDALVRRPKDMVAIQANSNGGLWVASTSEEQLKAFKERPFTLRASPHHIQVLFLGSAKDVAYVTYYLVGNIVRGDQVNNDYRTRVSQVMEKIDGQWVERGAHFSRLFGGSGIPSTN